MSAGGVAYCDDCGWQACLKAGCCLEAEAEALDVSTSHLELELLRPLQVVAGPSGEELDALATCLAFSLISHELSTGGRVVPHCEPIGVPLTSMPAGSGSSAPLQPCSGRPTTFSHDGDF